MRVCEHPDTFDCHGKPRCEVCYTDSIGVRPDGTLVWPAQDDPMAWTPERVARWFISERVFAKDQGCDGFTFARNNLEPSSLYGYVWVELTLDLDYYMAWMLDVRRHDPDDEWRQYLFVALKHGASGFQGNPPDIECSWLSEPRRFADADGSDLIPAIHAFAERTRQWLEDK